MWKNWNSCVLGGNMKLWNSMCCLKNDTQNEFIMYQSKFQVYIKKNQTQGPKQVFVCPHSYLLNHSSNLSVHWKIKKMQSIFYTTYKNIRNVHKSYVYATCTMGLLLSLKKEGNSVICYNMVNLEDLILRGHHTKWNKPVNKRQILSDFTYMREQE